MLSRVARAFASPAAAAASHGVDLTDTPGARDGDERRPLSINHAAEHSYASISTNDTPSALEAGSARRPAIDSCPSPGAHSESGAASHPASPFPFSFASPPYAALSTSAEPGDEAGSDAHQSASGEHEESSSLYDNPFSDTATMYSPARPSSSSLAALPPWLLLRGSGLLESLGALGGAAAEPSSVLTPLSAREGEGGYYQSPGAATAAAAAAAAAAGVCGAAAAAGGAGSVGAVGGHLSAPSPPPRLVDRDGHFRQSLGRLSIRKKIRRRDWRTLYAYDLFHSLVDAPTNRTIGILLGIYVG